MRFDWSRPLMLCCIGWQSFSYALQIPLRLSPPSISSIPATAPILSTPGVPPTHTPVSEPHSHWTRPRRTNSSAVVWDRYSLALGPTGNKRIFVFAAEFHPWRLPVPSLWRDILQRIKAAGFNTVDIYTHWGLVQPSSDPSTVALDGVNDLDFFLDVAKEVGLFVIVRPGPYINAETTAGGLAPWTTRLDAVLRTNDTEWRQAWEPYIHAISQVVRRHQVTYDAETGTLGGGSVIIVQADNEYHSGPAQRAYMQELVDSLKRWGVEVPISYNDASREKNFVDIVDLYGLDFYPQAFDCSHPDKWVQLRTDYLDYHLETNPEQPFMVPEFQGGSYDPYGGPGYEACEAMTGADFARVANHALIAQRATLLSIYMVYGGTNWGGLAEPDVYTSYSYGAAITESRQLTAKYHEFKAQGHFISTFPDLAMTEVVVSGKGENIVEAEQVSPDGSTKAVSPELIWSTELLNPATKGRFYVIRQSDSTSQRHLRYDLEVETLGERIVVGTLLRPDGVLDPAIHLRGRDSRIIPVDQTLPFGMLLRFTTARVFFIGTIGDTLFINLYGEPGDSYQWALASLDEDAAVFEIWTNDDRDAWQMTHTLSEQGGSIQGSFTVPRTGRGHAIERLRLKEHWVLLSFQSPEDVSNSYAPFVTYHNVADRNQRRDPSDLFGFSTDRVWITGAHLIRNASYSSIDTALDALHLFGSVDDHHVAPLQVFAARSVRQIFWNGERVPYREVSDFGGQYAVDVPGLSAEARDYVPPTLAELEWKYADSLPEVDRSAGWTVANRTESFNPYWKDGRVQTQGKVLFASEYGYHGNCILWRGRFQGQEVGEEAAVFEVEVEGGRSFAFSVWINDVWLGSAEADREHSAAKARFTLPKGSLHRNGTNFLTIVQDHMGIEMEYGALPIGLQPDGREVLEAVKLPRGILSYRFCRDDAAESSRPQPTTPDVQWKVAGNLGGEEGPDRVRTTLNEGGLFAERQGWHLPGYDDSDWPARSPTEGAERAGGLGFFRTTFSLDVPPNHDFSFAVVLPPFEDFRNATVPAGDAPPDFASQTGRSEGNYRVQIYVNGWQMGKRVSRLGPQTVFPVHDDVLHHRGENVLAVSLWSLGAEEEDRRLEAPIRLVVLGKATGRARDGYVLPNPTWKDLRS